MYLLAIDRASLRRTAQKRKRRMRLSQPGREPIQRLKGARRDMDTQVLRLRFIVFKLNKLHVITSIQFNFGCVSRFYLSIYIILYFADPLHFTQCNIMS